MGVSTRFGTAICAGLLAVCVHEGPKTVEPAVPLNDPFGQAMQELEDASVHARNAPSPQTCQAFQAAINGVNDKFRTVELQSVNQSSSEIDDGLDDLYLQANKIAGRAKEACLKYGV